MSRRARQFKPTIETPCAFSKRYGIFFRSLVFNLPSRRSFKRGEETALSIWHMEDLNAFAAQIVVGVPIKGSL